MARGSVGDVTFYRADGQQLARVRNRNPKNPKTEAQLYQRAIMATVIKAYQAGKEIFDHSFQGFSVGAQCQRQFMRLNAKMLRQLVATDINTPIRTMDQKARVVAPGVNTCVADPFIISRGSYQQTLFSYDPSTYSFKTPAALENEKVSEYAQRVNLIAGDIYTFIIFAEKEQMAYVSPNWDDALASLNYCEFGWVRCIVKDGLSNNTTTAQGLGQVFDFQSSGGIFDTAKSIVPSIPFGSGLNIESFLSLSAEGYTETGGLGLIRSRLDQDLRSDSEIQMNYGTDADNKFGIASDYILDEWRSGTTQVGNSELILEGGDE
jgi:hypothetical protein